MRRYSTPERLLVLLACAVLVIGVVLALGALRHPLPLVAAEGEHAAAAARLARGESLYVEPSLEYVNPTPAPLFHGASAVVMAAIGPGLRAPRLVALACAAVALWLAFMVVRRATGRALGGLVACALLVALEPDLDLAQPDSLLLCLLLAALLFLVNDRGAASGALRAAFCAALAWLVDPPAAPVVAAALAAGALSVRPKQAFVLLAVLGGLLAAGTLLLAGRPETYWFVYHGFELPERFSLETRAWIGVGVVRTLAATCVAWLALAWTAAASRAHAPRGDLRRATYRFVAAAALGLLAADFLLRPTGGATLACLHALLALAVGLAADVLVARCPAPGKQLVAAAVLLQVLLLLPDEKQARIVLPSAQRAKAIDNLVARASTIPGDLLAPFAPHLLLQIGRPPHASYPALLHLRRVDPPRAAALLQDLRERIAAKRYAAILWTEGKPPGFVTAFYGASPERPGILTPR